MPAVQDPTDNRSVLAFVRTPSLARAVVFGFVMFLVAVLEAGFNAWWSGLLEAALWAPSSLLLISARGRVANAASVFVGRPVAFTARARRSMRLPEPQTGLRVRAALFVGLTLSVSVLALL